MKKLTFLLLALLPLTLWSQTIGFHENFELPSLGDSLISSGTPNPWTISTKLSHGGLRCDSSKVTTTDTSYLTTAPFSTVGNSFVILHFSHICKIELLDAGEIEISVNNGPWVKLTSTEYIDPGNSQFINNGNKFNSNTYPLLWAPTNNLAVPTNGWWKEEQFDISALAANSPNIRIRFTLRDGNVNGANNNYGWLLDDVFVVMSFSELNPPVITYINPQFQNIVYNLGPYNVPAVIEDVSGIGVAKMFYKVNNGSIDSVTMTTIGPDTMQGTLPVVLEGDSIHYYIVATDASPAANTARNPVSGFRSFLATTGISLPFVDDFDGPSTLFYDTTMTPGTQWEWGAPAYGSTNSAHTPPNAWDVNLNTTYTSSAEAYLYTPIFDFSTMVNATLSFWLNYYVEGYCDGLRVDYTTDGTTWSTLGIMGDPNGTNWYNYSSISPTSMPAWSDNSSGWIKCSYILSALNNTVGPVQFRFSFDSDGSVEYDGFSIDDFAIIPPLDTEAVMVSAIVPDFGHCVAEGSYNLTVDFMNNGLLDITPPFNLVYQLDGMAPVSQAYSDTLYQGQTDTLQFTTPMILAPGNHNLLIYLEVANDEFTANDTLSYSFMAHGTLSLPYFNFLDSLGAFNELCAITGSFGRAFFDPAAANTGAGGVIMDASATTGWDYNVDTIVGSTYYVWDPAVDPEQYAGLSFTVNSATYSHVVFKFDAKEIFYASNLYTNFRVTVNGTQITPHMCPNGSTSGYITYEYDLSAMLPSPTLTIVFESKNLGSYNLSIPNGTATFIDNIQIYEPPAQEASLLAMPTPVSGCGLGAEPLTIQIRNSGSDTINGNLTAAYQVNNTPAIAPETVAVTMFPGDTLLYTFTSIPDLTVTTSDSIFDLKAWVTLTGDPFQFNDTINKSVESLFVPNSPITDTIIVIPYATDTLLTAISSGTLYWFDDPYSTNYLVMDSVFLTPILYDTTLFYVEARNGSAGSDFYVGTGTLQNSTTGYPCPYGQFYNGTHEQFLVPASELTAAGIGPGPINALSFDVVSPAGASLTNFTLSIGHTTSNGLSGWISGLNQVYSNASLANIVGWNEHLFTTPFVWDGASNLVVETCFDNYPNGYTTNAAMNQTSTTYPSTLDYHSDGGGVCTSGAPYPYNQRPNMKFKATAAGCPSDRIAIEVQVSGIPPYDAGVIAIDAPNTAVNLGVENIVVRILNFGSNAIVDFPVSYQVNGLPAVIDTMHTTMLPGDTASFIFTVPANLSSYNIYGIKSWTSLIGDTYAINDTAYKLVENEMPVYCASYATSTYDDDITNVTFAGINNNSPTPYSGTYSDYTGLTPAHVFRGGSYPISIGIGFSSTYGYAGYCEAYIDFNADGVFTDPAEVVFGGAYTTALVQTLTGIVNVPQTAQSGMTTMRIVAVESGSAATVVPCGSYSYGETEDYKVFISPILHKDAGIVGFVSPATSESQGANLPLTVTLKNNGLDTLNAVDIHWSFNAAPEQIYNWSGILAPGLSTAVTTGAVDILTAMNTAIAYTTLIGDSNSFNDTARLVSFGLPPVSMYLENFQEDTMGWEPMTLSLWQHGVPASVVINGAHSPTKCWKTRLVGNYLNNREDYLYSPQFNLSNITGAVLKFWQWWEAEPNDGGNLQYSLNGGTTWITLGMQNDPAGVNWYSHFTNGKYLWTGSYGGWQESIHDMSIFDNEPNVRFRYYFYSNATLNTYNGWAIDDFEIRVPKLPYDAGVVAVNEPAPALPGGLVSPKVVIKNFGLDTLLTIPVAYVITGGGMIIENWYGSLPPDSTANFNFTNTFIMPDGAVTFCSFTGMPADAYHFNDSTCVLVQNNTGIEDYLASGFALGQNIPNPAGDNTTIPFFIPENGIVILQINSVFGQLLVEKQEQASSGNHQIELNTRALAPGLYYYTLEYKGARLTRKMLIER